MNVLEKRLLNLLFVPAVGTPEAALGIGRRPTLVVRHKNMCFIAVLAAGRKCRPSQLLMPGRLMQGLPTPGLSISAAKRSGLTHATALACRSVILSF